MSNGRNLLIRPMLTEKAVFLSELANKVYTFEVMKRANKIEIMKAVTEMFSVKPLSCRVVNMRGKRRANIPYKGSVKRGHGITSSRKKMYVTMPRGVTIAELES